MKAEEFAKQLDKYVTRKVFVKGLDPYWNAYDKWGALLYQKDLHGEYLFFYNDMSDYLSAIRGLK